MLNIIYRTADSNSITYLTNDIQRGRQRLMHYFSNKTEEKKLSGKITSMENFDCIFDCLLLYLRHHDDADIIDASSWQVRTITIL